MKRAVVMFDVDGVLANFIEAFMLEYAHVHGRAFPLLYDEVRWDDLWDEKTWASIRSTKGWWTALRPLVGPGVFKQIDAMARDVYFVTARPGTDVKRQTETWLRLQGVEDPTVVLSSRKGEIAKAVGAAYSIEDKAGNAVYIAYQSPGTRSYLVDRPYNQFDHEMLGSKVVRVAEVEHFLDDIEREGA